MEQVILCIDMGVEPVRADRAFELRHIGFTLIGGFEPDVMFFPMLDQLFK